MIAFAGPRLADHVLAQIMLERDSAPRLRISQAGSDCARRTFYAATGAVAAPKPPKSRLALAMGSAFDAHVLPRNAGAGAGWLFQQSVEIVIAGVRVTGTADAIYVNDAGMPLHVADLKTIGETTWAKVQERPSLENQAQVNLYAYAVGAPTCSVLYVRKDPPKRFDGVELDVRDLMVEHVMATDPFAARKDIGLFEEVAYWIGKGTPPPRPFEDIEEEDGTVKIARDSFPCGWCDFNETCWGPRVGQHEKEESDGTVRQAE